MGRKRKVRQQTAKPSRPGAGFDGQFSPAVGSVPDPFDSTRRIAVTVNAAAPVARMRAQGLINEAEVAAADRFAHLASTAQIGGASAIDYARPMVDGGQLGQPLSVAVMDAHRDLAAISRVVGMVSYRILDLIISQERSVERTAEMLFGRQACGEARAATRAEQSYVSLRFRQALGEIVEHLGLEGRGVRGKGGVRASTETTTGPTREWGVGRFGDLEQVKRAAR